MMPFFKLTHHHRYKARQKNANWGFYETSPCLFSLKRVLSLAFENIPLEIILPESILS